MSVVEEQQQPVSQNQQLVEDLISTPIDTFEEDQENVEPPQRNSVPFKQISQNKQVDTQCSIDNQRGGLKDVTNYSSGLRDEQMNQQEATKRQIDQLLKEVKQESENYQNTENQQNVEIVSQQKNSNNNAIMIEENSNSENSNDKKQQEKQEKLEEEDKENKSQTNNQNKQQVYNNNKHQENIHKFYQTLIQKENQKKQQQLKPIASKIGYNTKISEVLSVSLENLNFGLVVPGNIFEEQLIIKNKLNETIIIEILILCLDKELDEHDEYIYSIRKTTGYDYNEKYVLKINPLEDSVFKIALKVPNLQNAKEILGKAQISVQNVNQKYSFPIRSKLELPKVICPKALFNPFYQTKVIKLAIKKGKKLDSKIPFKNLFNGNLNFEFEWLDTHQYSQSQDEMFQTLLHPGCLNVQPNNVFIVNVILKTKEGCNIMDIQENINIKKILLVKVKNSSVILTFPVEITVY